MRGAVVGGVPVLLALLAAPLPAAAQDFRMPRDPAAVEAFFDGLLPALMEAYHVPGVALSVVRGGRIVLEKGYGYADVEARRPVDPRSTRFRLASVSKLVTTTAVLQLEEAGRLDAHADLNRYLKRFQIEEAYGEPITLHHLLTHTAGFDDRFLRSGYALGASHPSLGDYLAERMPPRVMPPGELISYSNHGLALAGYLVEELSGQRFEDYVQEHVFDPLGMQHSTFGIPVPVPPEVAVAYQWEGGRQSDIGHDYTMLGPAAELVSTAHDMAKFMIAHLQLGRFGDQRILGGDAARRMQERQFSHDPRLPGWCYGFQEGELNGLRTIGHGGSWRGFRSALTLFPRSAAGVFVALNGEIQGAFWDAYLEGLADFLVPVPDPPKLAPPEGFAERASRYTGDYVPNRRDRGSLLKIGQFLTSARITASEEGTLVLTSALQDPLHLVEVEKDWFREVDGRRFARFLADGDDRVTALALQSFVLDRIPAWQSPRVHRAVASAGIALFAATLVGWGWAALARRLTGRGASPVSRPARLAASAVCLLYVASIVGAAASLQSALFFELLIEIPLHVKLQLGGAMLAAALTLSLPVFAWRGTAGAPALARVHYWLVVGTAFVLSWMSWYWNLLGFHD